MDLTKLKDEIPFKWRVQTANAYGANCVAFIDARDVQDKLDKVCSPEKWQVKYEEHKGNLFASIGILITQRHNGDPAENWVWKSDCGTESNVEKQKGEASDAFKRAAVMWGIGRFLYSKTIVKLATKENGTDRNNKPKYTVHIDGKFIYAADEITKQCNLLSEGKKTEPVKTQAAPVAAQPAEPVKKPNMTKAIFEKIVIGSKEEIEAALKAFTISEGSELKLNKALKAYG